MAQQRPSRHLSVVPAPRPAGGEADETREAYWQQLQALRDERRRLRAG